MPPPIIEFQDPKTGYNMIKGIVSCHITRTHGTLPNTITLVITEQTQPVPRTGTIYVQYEGTTIELPDCVVDDTSLQLDTRRRTNTLVIYDRRWKWQFGEISGNYNRRDDSGNLISRRYGSWNIVQNPDGQVDLWFQRGERTPQELASMLLDAMGERDGAGNVNYDVSDLPNGEDVRPEIDWDMANPGQELSHLCQLLGCSVVLQWDNRVKICKTNEGALLPVAPVGHPRRRYSSTIDSRQRPDSISVKTSPVVFQMDMELEAVGLDRDGVVRTLDQLSFHPSRLSNPQFTGAGDDTLWDDNWGFMSGFSCYDVAANSPYLNADGDETASALANQTVFKWYRIKTPFKWNTGTIYSQGDEQPIDVELDVDVLDKILPIYDFRATTVIENGRVVNDPSLIYGFFFQLELDKFENNTGDVWRFNPLPTQTPKESNLVVPYSYGVDVRKGIIKFTRPVVAEYTRYIGLPDTYQYYFGPARLYYRACFTYRLDTGDRIARTITRRQPEPHLGTKSFYVLRPELVPVAMLVYPETSGEGTSWDRADVFHNDQGILNIANEYIDALEKQFETLTPEMAEYVGLFKIELDGAIRSVSYSLDINAVLTMVHRQQDVGSPWALSYIQLRRQDQISRLMNDTRGRLQTTGLLKKVQEKIQP